MRQLHLVGITSDHEGLIFAARRGAKSGGFIVNIDGALLDEIEAARRLQAGRGGRDLEPLSRTRVESALSPREMQARLRVGRTVSEVAAEAGVTIEWVERFAAPVLAEQTAAIARAAQLTLHTPRRGNSDRPLSQALLLNLADRGVRLPEDEMDAAWSAFQRTGDEWLVRFRYQHRGRQMDAEWILRMTEGTLTPANRLATELGFVDPARHAPPVRDLPPAPARRVQSSAPPAAEIERLDVPVVVPAAGRRTSKKASSRRTAARRTTATARARATKRAPAKKGPARKAVAKKSLATKRATTKAAAIRNKAVAKRAPATRKAVAKRAPATGKAVAKRAPARKKAVAKRAPATGKAVAKRVPARKKAVAKRAPVTRKVAAKRTVSKRTAPTKPPVPTKRAAAVKRTSGRPAAKRAARPTARKAVAATPPQSPPRRNSPNARAEVRRPLRASRLPVRSPNPPTSSGPRPDLPPLLVRRAAAPTASSRAEESSTATGPYPSAATPPASRPPLPPVYAGQPAAPPRRPVPTSSRSEPAAGDQVPLPDRPAPEPSPGPTSDPVRINTRPSARPAADAPSSAPRHLAEREGRRVRRLRPLRASRIDRASPPSNGAPKDGLPSNGRSNSRGRRSSPPDLGLQLSITTGGNVAGGSSPTIRAARVTADQPLSVRSAPASPRLPSHGP